jgi:hypothetical protein
VTSSIHQGIYNFLSPNLIADDRAYRVPRVVSTSELCIQAEASATAEELSAMHHSLSMPSLGEMDLKKMLMSIQPPEWYQKGEHVLTLLRDAETLNWEADEIQPVDTHTFTGRHADKRDMIYVKPEPIALLPGHALSADDFEGMLPAQQKVSWRKATVLLSSKLTL